VISSLQPRFWTNIYLSVLVGTMKVSRLLSAIAFYTFVFVTQLFAQPAGKETKVMVRAIARDAKIIGKGVGGARITIREVSSGKVLAEGLLQDGTGETALIIEKPHVRGEKIYDTPGASGFLAVLNLERPTVVEVTAEGPLSSPEATQRSSKTLLLVPGEGHTRGWHCARDPRIHRENSRSAVGLQDQVGIAVRSESHS
jgi:hypothetical protein